MFPNTMINRPDYLDNTLMPRYAHHQSPFLLVNRAFLVTPLMISSTFQLTLVVFAQSHLTSVSSHFDVKE